MDQSANTLACREYGQDCRDTDAPWVLGKLQTSVGNVTRVSTDYTLTDRIGSWRVRWAIGRARYSVPPGVYAVGRPSSESPVLVTANYKKSFDCLRRELTGRNVWVVVLDTKGINVWCAAGKGTFGTQELVERLAEYDVDSLVSHRTVILPQLGASGVSAHEVSRRSGFKVVYGPVRASDLPAFLDSGMRATPDMRRVQFSLRDRLVLTPVEMVLAGKYILPVLLLFLLASGLSTKGYAWDGVAGGGLRTAVALGIAWLAGTLAGPVLLPWLPGRSFSMKGGLIGAVCGLLLVRFVWSYGQRLEALACILTMIAISSFVLMNFTGASTFTSPSGVKREMKVFVPIQVGLAVIGTGLWVANLFIS